MCSSVCIQGGVKVLITGPWSEQSGRYSCVFDQTAVPASLIQPGVLRCYCPGTHWHCQHTKSSASETVSATQRSLPDSLLTLSLSLWQPTRPGWCVCKFWSLEVPCPRQSSSSIEPGMPARCPAPSSTGSRWTVGLETLLTHSNFVIIKIWMKV